MTVSMDKRTPHYHVGANIPGYLPEGGIFCTDSLDAAIESLRHELKDQQDDYYESCEGHCEQCAEFEACGDTCECAWCSVAADVEAALSAIADGDAVYRLAKGQRPRLFGIRLSPPEGPDVAHWAEVIETDRTTCDLNPDSDTYIGE